MGLYLTCANSSHLDASIINPGIVIPLATNLPCHATNRTYLNNQLAGGYYCWGCKPRRTPTFLRLNVGYEVLISKNGTDLIDYHGIITHLIPYPDSDLANAIWKSNHENIFLVSNIRPNMGINKNDFMLDLTGENDTLQSPRDYSKAKDPHIWNRYNAIKGKYGI